MDTPVINDRIAAYILQCLSNGNATAAPADDYCDLPFIIEKATPSGTCYRSAVMGERTKRLHKIGWRCRRSFHMVLLNATAIRQVCGYNLGRLNRGQIMGIRLLDHCTIFKLNPLSLGLSPGRNTIVQNSDMFHGVISLLCW